MSIIEDISNKKNVYPSLNQIKKWGYEEICSIKSKNTRNIENIIIL